MIKHPKKRLAPRRSGSVTQDYLIPVLLAGLSAILILVLLVVLGALAGILSLK